MLGHRDLRSTQIYANITEPKIAEDMQKTESRIEDQDSQTGRIIDKGKDVTKVNRTLDDLEQEMQSHYCRLVLEDGYVTAEALKTL